MYSAAAFCMYLVCASIMQCPALVLLCTVSMLLNEPQLQNLREGAVEGAGSANAVVPDSTL